MPSIRAKVYDGNNFILDLPFKRQLRSLPNGSRGIVFRGKVYQVFEDKIDIKTQSFNLDECKELNASKEINEKNIIDNIFFDQKTYNPIFYFNGLSEDLDSFLFALDADGIQYLQAATCNDLALNNKKYDFFIKFSKENLDEKKLLLDDLINLFKKSSSSPFIGSIQRKIINLLNSDIEETKIQDSINRILLDSPKFILDKLFYLMLINSFSNKNNEINKKYIFENEKLISEIKKKDEEIETFNELLNKKITDYNKDKKIGEQILYIQELEDMIDDLIKKNDQLRLEVKSVVSTNLKKKFLNFISETIQTTMPRLRLIYSSELTIFEKFENVNIIFEVLKNLNDKVKIKFKKIHTIDNWFEVDDHISTGREKRGRVYFASLKNNLLAIMVDYKINDKDQIKKIKKLGNIDLSVIN